MKDEAIRVLSIEDNLVEAELIQEKLAEAQRVGWDLPRFEVEHVARLEPALERLDDGEFDVVLSDLDLPDSRAGETVATLREHIPQMPLVVLTGREDETLAQKSVRAGVQDYIYKNEATGSLLARSMMYAIERQQAHAELEQRVEERTAELKDREEHYQSLFENAPISIWEEDFSAVKERIDDLQDSGVRDFSTYFRQHSELVKELAAQVKVLNINRRTFEIYGAKDKSEFYQGLNEIFGEASYEAFIDTLCVIADGDTEFASEKTDQTLEGEDIEVDLQWSVVPGHEDTYSKVLVSIADITERKQAEERMEHLNRVLRAVRNVNQLITQETDRDRLLQGACDNLTETRGYQSAWIALNDQSRALIATAESGLGEDFLPLVERMNEGHLPLCGERALAQKGVLSIPDPASSCPECPLSDSYNHHGALFVRLEHGGQVYGWGSYGELGEMWYTLICD